MSKFCSNCYTENIDEAKFCRKCGKQDFTLEDNSIKNNVNVNKSQDEQKVSEKLSSKEISEINKINQNIRFLMLKNMFKTSIQIIIFTVIVSAFLAIIINLFN